MCFPVDKYCVALLGGPKSGGCGDVMRLPAYRVQKSPSSWQFTFESIYHYIATRLRQLRSTPSRVLDYSILFAEKYKCNCDNDVQIEVHVTMTMGTRLAKLDQAVHYEISEKKPNLSIHVQDSQKDVRLDK